MQEGQKIRDYVLEEKIGEGGMGEVWRARHAILDRQVAIKAMARHLETDPEFGRRFLQEAQSQARLNHPRIVGVSDFFAEDGQYFLVMPLMSGKSLADRLHELQSPLPVSDALVVARDVLEALDHAHQEGIIHRDVKPSNILLDRDGHASLTDFGIALSLGRHRVTLTRTSLGTPHYMSPEQIRSPKTVDHRTDVYSFGCVLYEMLTGRPPFAEAADAEDTDFAVKEAHVYQAPEPLRKWNPRVPAWLEAVVLRALAKNPDERFLGCGEFRRTLDEPDAALPLSPAAPEPVRAAKKPGPAAAYAHAQARPRGRHLPTVLIGLALAVLAALVVFAMRDRGQPGGPAADELTTDFTTAAPADASIGVVEITEEGGEPREQETAEPLGTDLEAVEPEEEEAAAAGPAEGDAKDAPPEEGEAGPPQPKEKPKAGPPKPEEGAKKKKKPQPPETLEPITTDIEVQGGIKPPMDTDLGTVEPLGTDLRPPGR
jgi:eukaryotic-like serine/threonine-protein kinase